MSWRIALCLLNWLFCWSVVSFWFLVSVACIQYKISLLCHMWLYRPQWSCGRGYCMGSYHLLSSWCYSWTGECQNQVTLRFCLVSRRDLLGTVLKSWGICGTTLMFVTITSYIILVEPWFLHGLYASLARLCYIQYKNMLVLSGFFSAFYFLQLRFSICIPFLLAPFLL